MSPMGPNLMTLLAWADRLAAGEDFAEWKAWCASSPTAAGQWEKVTAAEELLASGDTSNPEPAIDAEELAALIEGRLDPDAAQPVESVSWQSTAQLAEALSTARFRSATHFCDVSASLEQRLLALGPKPQNGHADGAVSTVGIVNKAVKPLSARAAIHWRWALAARAPLVVAHVSDPLGWLVATAQYARREQPLIVPAPEAPSPPSSQSNEPPPEEHNQTTNSEGSAPASTSHSLQTDSSPTAPAATPPDSSGKSLNPGKQPRTPKIIPQQPQPRPFLPAPPVLACRSVQGLLLVDPTGVGRWRALQGPFVLREPAKIVSLAESWSTTEIPGFGTLIWDGPAEAELSVRADGLVEIRLTQGKLGIQGMPAGAQVRLETGGANWTARALEGDATWAVIDDPLTPAMLFVNGAIGIETMRFSPKQIVRWQEGVPEPVATSSDSNSLPATVPALGNPWD